jgi:2,3-bisphosphoglycerate-dependent phosphoglycerate mutase
MPKLVLIKHAMPEVQPGLPPSMWPLSQEGRRSCEALVAPLRPLGLERVMGSREPKATETGRALALGLGVPFEVREGLHEHERGHEGFEPDRPAFESKIEGLFENKAERVYGSESGTESLERFRASVLAIVAENEAESVAIVAHGTVISLLVAESCGLDGFELWRRLGLPSYVVLETPKLRLLDVVESVSVRREGDHS